MELAVHQVIGGGNAMQAFHFRGPRKAANAGFAHQNSHQTLAHLKFHADRQLRMHPAGTIGLPGRDMDFVDQSSEPKAPHLGGRYWPVFVSVVAGAAHSEESAALLGPVADLDKVVNYRVNPFGPGRSSPEELRGDLQYLDFCFELPDPLFSFRQLGGFRRSYPGSFAAVDLILAHPFMKCCCAHAKLHGRSGDGFAGSHKSDRSQTELGREWSWHG